MIASSALYNIQPLLSIQLLMYISPAEETRMYFPIKLYNINVILLDAYEIRYY